VLDDCGLAVLTQPECEDPLAILEDRHGRSSTIVTSQVPVAQWDAVIGTPTLADAILDRLIHNAHRIELKRESMRRMNAGRGATVETLDAKQPSRFINKST
jgi:DNA replication protein DnaC